MSTAPPRLRLRCAPRLRLLAVFLTVWEKHCQSRSHVNSQVLLERLTWVATPGFPRNRVDRASRQLPHKEHRLARVYPTPIQVWPIDEPHWALFPSTIAKKTGTFCSSASYHSLLPLTSIPLTTAPLCRRRPSHRLRPTSPSPPGLLNALFAPILTVLEKHC